MIFPFLISLSTEFLEKGNALPDDVRSLRHIESMSWGRQDKDCKAMYPKCKAELRSIMKALNQ